MILPETSTKFAMPMAERIRQAVEVEPLDIGEAAHVTVTVSIGIAAYPEQVSTIRELVKAADLAMYTSKLQGRNRTTVYSPNLLEAIPRDGLLT